jgi:hypothetical protein
LWEIPVTQGFTRRPACFWQACHETVATTWLSRLRLIGLAQRLGVVEKVWLSFENPANRNMLSFLRKLRRWQVPCIAFNSHSSSFLACGNPYARTPADVEQLFVFIEEVFAAITTWPEFRPVTVTEAARQLEEEYHARSRH